MTLTRARDFKFGSPQVFARFLDFLLFKPRVHLLFAFKFLEPLVAFLVSLSVSLALLGHGFWGVRPSFGSLFMHVHGTFLALVFGIDFLANCARFSAFLRSDDAGFNDVCKKDSPSEEKKPFASGFAPKDAQKGRPQSGRRATGVLDSKDLEPVPEAPFPKAGEGSSAEPKGPSEVAPESHVHKWALLLKIEKRLHRPYALRFVMQAALLGFFSFLNAELFLKREFSEPRMTNTGGAVLHLVAGSLLTFTHLARNVARRGQRKDLRNVKLLLALGLLCYVFYFFRAYRVLSFQTGVLIFVLLDSLLFLLLMVFVKPDKIFARHGLIGLLLQNPRKERLGSFNLIIVERAKALLQRVFALAGKGPLGKPRFLKGFANAANKTKWTLDPLSLELRNPLHQTLCTFTYNAHGVLFRRPFSSLVLNSLLLLGAFAVMFFAGVLSLPHLLSAGVCFVLFPGTGLLLRVLRRDQSTLARLADAFDSAQQALLLSVVWLSPNIGFCFLLGACFARLHSRWPLGLRRFWLPRLVFLGVLASKLACNDFSQGNRFLQLFLLALLFLAETCRHYLRWETFYLARLSTTTKSTQHLYLLKCLKRLLPSFIVSKLLSREPSEKKKNDRSSTIEKRRRRPHTIQRFDQMKFLADDAGRVNILFCEICGLDINERANLEVLDILYADFDRLCRRFGVQKIETVGKVYVACSGLALFEAGVDPALRSLNSFDRLFNFAVELHKHIERFAPQLPLLKVKVGVHSGNCIYGFFGLHKPQFSLIGDSVNTASRHCKVSTPGRIVLSKQFYAGISNPKGIIFKVA